MSTEVLFCCELTQFALRAFDLHAFDLHQLKTCGPFGTSVHYLILRDELNLISVIPTIPLPPLVKH